MITFILVLIALILLFGAENVGYFIGVLIKFGLAVALLAGFMYMGGQVFG